MPIWYRIIYCYIIIGLIIFNLICVTFAQASEVDYQYVMVHHTDTPAETLSGKPFPIFDKALCDAMARQRGWDECGYNYLISRDGIVYKGRELGKPGAHCPTHGMNRKAIAVAFILKGEVETPSKESIEAFNGLYRQLSGLFDDGLKLTFHADHKPTICPSQGVRKALQ